MSSIPLQVLNPKTGEVMDGQIAYIGRKHCIFKDGYVAVSQPALNGLVEDKEVPLVSFRLLVWLLQFIEHNNKIPLIASELIELYPYGRDAFYKALKPLLNHRIFIVDRKQGRNVYYALNSNFGWKGKVKNWYTNDPEDPLFDLDKTQSVS